MAASFRLSFLASLTERSGGEVPSLRCGPSEATGFSQVPEGARIEVIRSFIPIAGDCENGRRAELERLDQVVVDVGVDAGLLEGVEGRACRAAGYEPSL